jgi:O-antigen ligase
LKKTAEIAFNFLPVLFAFLMPFGGFLSVLLILWFISSWFCFNKEKFRSGVKNKWFLCMILFFVLHIISGLLSDNLQEGISGIERKLSFLAFPYFFFLFDIKPETIRRMVIAFVSGCFFALLACLCRSTYIYASSGENEFFYNLFSFFIHSSCFSMYLLFALLILIFVYPVWFSEDKWLKVMTSFFGIVFGVGIFLCASKMGYIAATLALILVPFFRFRDKLNFTNISITLALLIGFFIIALKIFPKPFERINNAFTAMSTETIDKTSGESTAVRLLVWGEARKVIKENFWFGVGTGEVNDVLKERYKQEGLTGALEHNLNAHNEYYQTTLGIGFVGLITLLLLTFGPLIRGILRNQNLLLLFGLIIILNFLVEAMLQRQDGNLFFVFFLCLLLSHYDELRKKPETYSL